MNARLKTATPLAVALAAGLALSAPVMAHGQQGHGYGQGAYGPCAGHQAMMMPGSGMMGPGSGMMGPGSGMMGPGSGMMGPGSAQRGYLDRDLSTDDVRSLLDHRLRHGGNDRLRVGKVEAGENDTIVAEIETVDGSLVERLAIDPHTGATRRMP